MYGNSPTKCEHRSHEKGKDVILVGIVVVVALCIITIFLEGVGLSRSCICVIHIISKTSYNTVCKLSYQSPFRGWDGGRGHQIRFLNILSLKRRGEELNK